MNTRKRRHFPAWCGRSRVALMLGILAILAFVSSLTYFSLLAPTLRSKQASVDITNGPLFVDPRLLDRGEMWIEKESRWQLPLLNTTDIPLTINGIDASCSCTSVSPTSLVLQPRTPTPITITLDPLKVSHGHYPSPFSVDLLIHFTSGTEPGSLPVRAKGVLVSALNGYTHSVNLGEIGEGEETPIDPIYLDLVNGSDRIEVASSDPRIEFSLERDVMRPEWVTLIGFVDARGPAPINFDALLSVTSKDNKAKGVYPIHFNGTITRDICIHPRDKELGLCQVGDEISFGVSVTSRTGRTIKSFSLYSQSPEVRISPKGQNPRTPEFDFAFKANEQIGARDLQLIYSVVYDNGEEASDTFSYRCHVLPKIENITLGNVP